MLSAAACSDSATGHREDQAVVTAFDDQLAEAFHTELPSVAITPGLSAMTSYVLQNIKPPADRKILQVPPDYEGVQVLTPGFIERAKADGMVLWIWPNERKWENAAGYTRLLDMGVEGINAADPKVAVDALPPHDLWRNRTLWGADSSTDAPATSARRRRTDRSAASGIAPASL